jgi:hypothetical protein
MTSMRGSSCCQDLTLLGLLAEVAQALEVLE